MPFCSLTGSWVPYCISAVLLQYFPSSARRVPVWHRCQSCRDSLWQPCYSPSNTPRTSISLRRWCLCWSGISSQNLFPLWLRCLVRLALMLSTLRQPEEPYLWISKPPYSCHWAYSQRPGCWITQAGSSYSSWVRHCTQHYRDSDTFWGLNPSSMSHTRSTTRSRQDCVWLLPDTVSTTTVYWF